MISNRATLAVFYGTGGLLLLLVAHSTAWRHVNTALLDGLAGITLSTAVLLSCLRQLRPALMHVLLITGSAVIALAVRAADGGIPSGAVSMFTVWVVVYGSLFLPRRQAALHAVVALGSTAIALRLVEATESALLHTALLVAVVGTMGLVAGALTRRTRVLSTTDPLTGLLNEVGLSHVVAGGLIAVDECTPGLLLLIDIDHFGELNQALGRDGGDAVLQHLARAYERELAEGGSIARLGGDDFVVWLPSAAALRPELSRDLDGTSREVERLITAITARANGTFDIDDIAVEVDVTVGAVLVAEGRSASLKTLLQRADTALRAARQADLPVRLWHPALEARTAESLKLQAELRCAITDGQLRVHYQPLVDAHSRQMRGVEALVRWQHPRLGLLTPAAFIPEAERSSTIVALTEWVLHEAVDQAASWARAGRPLRVSVNLSARLLAHEGLAAYVETQLRRSGLPPELLMLEVTESAVTAQPRRAAAALAELRSRGICTALDDFGTGYTSLAMLQDFPFDELKVDRRFVANALNSAGDEAIVRAVAELAHRMGFEVVGEGVEDEATSRLLAGLGYDLLQGYHFSRPVPAVDVLALDCAPTPQVARTLTPAQEQARATSADQHATLIDNDDPILRELTAVAARVIDVPVAMVTLIGKTEQHMLAPVGTDSFSMAREDTFCHHVVNESDLIQVPDTTADVRFKGIPIVKSGPHIRFYAGAPITDAAGHVLGTVCVLDQRPRTLSAVEADVLRGLARAAAARLASRVDAASIQPLPDLVDAPSLAN
ncbi:hypothetical protein GCM10023225_15520 [Kineococcus glutinatus]|uniref:Diguanylate cyclase (GGDEF)-like protein n=2 Tax=Kineococcus glutinatus TaxID=1070872 RepID=A0ABP9HNW7_9ACTN